MHLSFDFDYTLADSSEGTVACANFAFRRMGMVERPPADIKRTIGLNLRKTYEVLCGEDGELAAEFERHFFEHAEQVMLGHIRIYDGTTQVLRTLKEHGHYISIVSTKRKERIHEALVRDGLEDLVDDVVGGSCVRNNKPDPEGLMLAVSRSYNEISETVFVGDSVSDAECAYRAGVSFIGVLTGTTGREQLGRWGALAVLRCIGDVPILFAQSRMMGKTFCRGDATQSVKPIVER